MYDYMANGSVTERLYQPKPILPPFKTNGLRDTLNLRLKKPIKNINIVESFNKSLNQAKIMLLYQRNRHLSFLKSGLKYQQRILMCNEFILELEIH